MDPLRKEFITIQRPETCGTVWIAYSQHMWTPATLDRFAADATLRAERMQPIEPANWVQSPQPAANYAPMTAPSVLESVMEYQQWEGPGNEPPELPHFSVPLPLSNRDGTFNASVLSAYATRYPWYRRITPTVKAGVDPLLQRHGLLCEYSSNGRVGEDRKAYMPNGRRADLFRDKNEGARILVA